MKGGLSVFAILMALLVFFGLSYSAVATYVGIGVHADQFTVFLGTILVVEVAFGLWAAYCLKAFELMAMLVFLLSQYFFPRIFGYIGFTRESLRNLYILFPVPWNASLINQGLVWVVWSTGAIIVAFLLAIVAYQRWAPRWSKGVSTPVERRQEHGRFAIKTPSLMALFLAAVIIYGVDTYFTLYLGQSASKNCIDETIRGKWLIHFFSGDMVIFYTLTLLATQYDRLSRAQWVFLLGSVLVYLAYTLALGSRGGILRISTILFSLWLAAAPYARIRLKAFVTMVPVVAVISAGFFIFGTVARQLASTACSGGQVDVAEALEDFESNGLDEKFLDAPGSKQKLRDRTMIQLPPSLAKISDRLGIIDYAVGVVAVPGDEEAKARYINFKYMAKNLANNLVIGVPFEDAKYMTSSMMPIIYRHFDYKHVEENFLSDMWTLWGSSYAMFGPYVGLLFVFLLCFAFQFIFLLGSDRLGSGALFFRAGMIWIGCAAVVFFHMSFDHAAFLIFVFHFQTAVTLGLIFGLDRLIGLIRKGRGTWKNAT